MAIKHNHQDTILKTPIKFSSPVYNRTAIQCTAIVQTQLINANYKVAMTVRLKPPDCVVVECVLRLQKAVVGIARCPRKTAATADMDRSLRQGMSDLRQLQVFSVCHTL